MDCVMDGGSDNFKLCFSTGCFTGGGKTTQSPAAVRVQAQATVTVASGATCSTALPPLGSLGGEAFLAALAATLNVYKVRPHAMTQPASAAALRVACQCSNVRRTAGRGVMLQHPS
jgi:hypothetical protein